MVMAREGFSTTFFFSHENLTNLIMKKENDAQNSQREREKRFDSFYFVQIIQ